MPFAIEMVSPSAATAFEWKCEGTTAGPTTTETTGVTMEVVIGAGGKTENGGASGVETAATAGVTAAVDMETGSATTATVVTTIQWGTTRARKATSSLTTSGVHPMRSGVWTVGLQALGYTKG